MIDESFLSNTRRGFSLVELLIVLFITVALIAIITPFGVNASRKSLAISLSADLKSISRAFINKMCLDGEVPQAMVELGRNVDTTSFGAAWKENQFGELDCFVFTNREANFQLVSEILISSRQGIPSGIDEYVFLDGGLQEESINSQTVYYGLQGEKTADHLTELGSTFDEITEGITNLIREFFSVRGSYPRDWGEYRYEDLSLDSSFWGSGPIEGVVYKPAGRLLRVSPGKGYKFVFSFLDSTEKGELTEDFNWDLIYNIGDATADTDSWFFHSLDGRKIDVSTIEILKML